MSHKRIAFVCSLSVVIFAIGVSSIEVIGSSTILNSTGNSSVDTAAVDDVLSAKDLDPNEKDMCKDRSNCPFRDTSMCINTQGSYDCVCKPGYTKWDSFSVESVGCKFANTENGPPLWWIGIVVLIIVAGVIAVGARYYIIYKRGHGLILFENRTEVSVNVTLEPPPPNGSTSMVQDQSSTKSSWPTVR